MLKDADILQIIASELSNCDKTESDSTLEKSLDYYLGNPRGDEIEGRSRVISTDVADSIEWLMPQIMKAFTENNEVVIFDPSHEGDEKQSQLESEFVYDIIMKDNDGFILLHTFIKDALMQNNGILKTYFEDNTETKTESYSGVTQEQLAMLAARDDVEILSMSDDTYMDPAGTLIPQYSIKCAYTLRDPKICIEAIPPEQFRINSAHNSINPDTARFTAHQLQKTASDLILEGFDKKIVKDLPSTNNIDSEYRYNAQGETALNDSQLRIDESMRLIDIAECYMMLDRDEDGIAEKLKITVACSDDTPTHILGVDEIDEWPWVATTAILMSHKFKGLSVFDRIRQIQDQKTALIRNILDNLYLQNNRMKKVVEGRVEIDDLMISRPGGIVRVKSMDALEELITQPIGNEAYQMIEYLDQVRAGRTGVSAEGSTAPQNVGNQIGSEGVERLMTAKEELCGLIIRVIAETGIKPLCMKIRDLCIKHMDVVKDYQFRGQWVQVAPKQWPPRSTATVRVGTGTGDHNRQLQAITTVMTLQEKLAVAPQSQVLVNLQKSFDTIDDFCKFSGLNGANRFFVDPSSPEGQQAAQAMQESNQAMQEKQDQIEQLQAQMQVSMSEAATKTAESELQMVQAKFEADRAKAMLEDQKQKYESQIRMLEQQIKQGLHTEEMIFKYDELAAKMQLEQDKLANADAQAFIKGQNEINKGLQQ